MSDVSTKPLCRQCRRTDRADVRRDYTGGRLVLVAAAVPSVVGLIAFALYVLGAMACH
jgi:hypothetical protein